MKKFYRENIFCFFALVVVSVICSSFASIQPDGDIDLKVIVKGLRNDKGSVLVALFDNEEHFLKVPYKSFSQNITSQNDISILFQGLHTGIYAVSVIHDENQNQKLDTNFIGIPKEGIGASNDAQSKFGPPKFEEAKFELREENNIIVIHLKYLL